MTEQSTGNEVTRILVLDDNPDRAAATAAQVEKVLSEHARKYEISHLSGDKLQPVIVDMFSLYREFLKSGKIDRRPIEAEIAIVDYNLSEIHFEGAIHTADTIIGYARTISSGIYYVALNRNESVDFDLRYAIGDYDSKSDASLNSSHLPIPSLWSDDAPRSGFRPWYWPELIKAQARRRKLISHIGKNLEDGVLKTLGLSDLDIDALSLHARGFLESAGPKGDGRTLGSLTFLDVFLSTGRSLSQDDRARILANFRDGKTSFDPMLQIVAHEIDVWLRRDLIGGQDVLVDIPHLVERYPFLLGESVGDKEAWKATTGNSESALSLLRRGRHWERLDRYLLPDWQIWSDRPVFRWRSIDADDELVEQNLRFEWKDSLDLVFVEDTSCFLDRKSARRFNLETETSYPSRYVEVIDGFSYVPMSRLAS
ncbi:hypothetical protein [Mesorhizobium carmichaelinearum]|uniref:hypothetical protein n=1 Tax=Mesorhizobium carmichaelinearum TaxID=1208188 RepID=UPI000BA3F598|nr:hypothetical protein [Mesorhizobium carmichaelinearum]